MARGHRAWEQLLQDWSRVIAYWLMVVGGIGCLVTLGYLAYGLFNGALASWSNLSAADQLRFQQNVGLATNGLLLSALVFIAGIFLRLPGQFSVGYGLVVCGALLFFGVPFFFQRQFGNGIVQNKAIYTLSFQLMYLGRALLAIGLIACALDALSRIYGAIRKILNRRAQRLAEAKQYGMDHVRRKYKRGLGSPRGFRPCWDLPICQDYMRHICPVFKEKKACWKTKTGCMCDPDFILKVAEGSQEVDRAKLTWLVGTKESQRIRTCAKCAVYDSHQKEKADVLLTFAIPFGIFSAWWVAPRIHNWYLGMVDAISGIIYQISLVPGVRAREAAYAVTKTLEGGTIEILLVLIIGLWAVILYSRMVELFILDLKW